MIAQTEKKIYTPETYLEFELSSDERHEYIDGELIPMTGGTPNHNEIASILNAALRMSLKGQPYSIFVADQRLWIPEYKIYTYPDVMVIQRPIALQEGRLDTVMNPVAIAEVLSKTTKSYDKDGKFAAYRSIPGFQEYLLIDQYSLHIEMYSKTEANKWIFSEYKSPGDRIVLSSISFAIALADLYDNIDF